MLGFFQLSDFFVTLILTQYPSLAHTWKFNALIFKCLACQLNPKKTIRAYLFAVFKAEKCQNFVTHPAFDKYQDQE